MTTPPSEQPNEPSATTEPWGRVSDDGTVYVRTADGERAVGQMPDATAEEALAFFTKRYDDLAFEVDLLEQRVKAGTVGPDEAAAAVKQVHATLAEAQAVGDLAGLDTRLDALTGTIDAQREKRKVERAAKLEAARGDKERIATEAEKLAEGNDWRNGANRLRDLLDEWKALPRLEKSVDDALWRRFSTARTTYTRRRKAHFGELNEKREGARAVKERLVKEAEALADSTEWGPTAGKYRDLMRQWKAAGPAPRGVDDQLWKRFRAAQDTFFGARDAAAAETDREFAANAEKKEALLVEAEKLRPGHRPQGREGGVPRHRRALGRGRQGPPRADEGARGPHPQGRAGDPRRRGRPVAPVQPRGPRPRRRHGRAARVLDRRPGGQAPEGRGRRQRQEGGRARLRPRGPPRLARRGPEGPRRLQLTGGTRRAERPAPAGLGPGHGGRARYERAGVPAGVVRAARRSASSEPASATA